MPLAAQWREIEQNLPEGWAEVRLSLAVADERQADRAAALLGPLAPGRRGHELRFSAVTRGAGPSPGAVRRALERLDAEGVAGRVEMLAAPQTVAAAADPLAERRRRSGALAAAWDAELAALPADWSDLYAEVEFDSSDHLDRGALLLAPVNPARYGGATGFRFRCARRFGYGVSPEMAHRCLERLDEEGLTGRVRILRALSDTSPVDTQGPVWYVGGKAV